MLLRKPLLLVFSLGCGVSALVSGRFSVRLILDGAISFAFVPAIEMATFAAVLWIGGRRTQAARRMPLARAVDLFFSGNTPWLLWIAVLAALGGVVPPTQVGPWIFSALLAAIVPIAWSAYLDFHFFRDVMSRPSGGAAWDLVLFRAIAWSGATAYFFGIAIWAEIVPRVFPWMGR